MGAPAPTFCWPPPYGGARLQAQNPTDLSHICTQDLLAAPGAEGAAASRASALLRRHLANVGQGQWPTLAPSPYITRQHQHLLPALSAAPVGALLAKPYVGVCFASQ